MKVRTCVAVSAMCLLNISPAHAFDVSGVGLLELNRTLFGAVLADLLVSDKMRVSNSDFCIRDGKLMLSGLATPKDKSEYSAEFIAEIVSERSVAVTVSTAHMPSPDRGDIYIWLWACDPYQSKASLLPVKTINGYDTLDAYLKSDFVTKLPKP